MNRRVFLKRAAGAVVAAGTGSLVYAIAVEPHWLDIVTRDLPIEGLPPGLEGATLAQLSDIHIGPRVSDKYIVSSFGRIRALQPDIVTISGDFISYSADRGLTQFDQLRDVLSHVPRGRLATLGILGNHDYGRAWREPEVAARVVAEAERAGVQILRNETQNVAGLDIIGIDDLWARRFDPAAAFNARISDAALVLVHNPDAADVQQWQGYRGWMLAGHTHGGQCRSPFLRAPIIPVKNPRYVSGEVQVDEQRKLYINRGVGHLIRARFNVRPEVTIFTLRRASSVS